MRLNLRLLRVKNGLTQDQMAERLGVTRSTYCNIENGKSDGRGVFWMTVEKEFPGVNIGEMMKKGAQSIEG